MSLAALFFVLDPALQDGKKFLNGTAVLAKVSLWGFLQLTLPWLHSSIILGANTFPHSTMSSLIMHSLLSLP